MRNNYLTKNVCFVVIMILCGTHALKAQTATITGRIENEKHAPVPFTNIAVLTTDNKLVKGVLCDSSGIFSIKNIAAGKYVLQITSIGYMDLKLPTFEIAADAVKDLG